MSVEVFKLSLRRVRQRCVLRSEGSDEAGEKVGALRGHHGGARKEVDALLSMSLPRLQFSSVSWRLKYSLVGSRHHCDIRELTMKVGPAERCRCRPVPSPAKCWQLHMVPTSYGWCPGACRRVYRKVSEKHFEYEQWRNINAISTAPCAKTKR